MITLGKFWIIADKNLEVVANGSSGSRYLSFAEKTRSRLMTFRSEKLARVGLKYHFWLDDDVERYMNLLYPNRTSIVDVLVVVPVDIVVIPNFGYDEHELQTKK